MCCDSVTIGSCEWRVCPQIPAIPRTALVRTHPAEGPDDNLGLHGEREGVEGATSLPAPVGAAIIDAEYLVEHVHGDNGSPVLVFVVVLGLSGFLRWRFH